MSPLLSAANQLSIGLRAIALAFDRDGITIAAAADALGVPEGVVHAAVAPFTDLEYVHSSGQLLDDIGHVVTVDDGWIRVQQNWFHDLTSLTPGDAALLLAMIETAGHIEGIDSVVIRGLRRRLDAIAHVSMGEAVPPAVADLLSAKHGGYVVSALYERGDMRVGAEPSLFEVHEVRWTEGGWRVLVTDYGDPDAAPRDLVAERLHDIRRTEHRFERRSLTAPEARESGITETVTLAYPDDDAWLVAYFNPEVIGRADGVTTARIRIDTNRPLRRLLLRLGADARIVDPPHLVDAGADAARRILDLYER